MMTHLFVAEAQVRDLDALLRPVADDQCSGVMIMPLDLAWIYHPYDGGADFIASTTSDRDRLRDMLLAEGEDVLAPVGGRPRIGGT